MCCYLCLLLVWFLILICVFFIRLDISSSIRNTSANLKKFNTVQFLTLLTVCQRSNDEWTPLNGCGFVFLFLSIFRRFWLVLNQKFQNSSILAVKNIPIHIRYIEIISVFRSSMMRYASHLLPANSKSHLRTFAALWDVLATAKISMNEVFSNIYDKMSNFEWIPKQN